MANKNFFMNGITELLILSLLHYRDRYVYEIVKSLTEISKGHLNISLNTIYTATYKLVTEGMISEYSKLVGKKRTRVYYKIEPKGLEYLCKLEKSYFDITTGIKHIQDFVENEKPKSEDE